MNHICSLPLQDVSVDDDFWKGYMELIRRRVIPYQWQALNDRIEGAEPSSCIHNFKVAAGEIEGQFQGMVFQDSDLYKWLEAVSYTFSWYPDAKLEALADEAVDLICAAQQPDGYLNTYYIINGIDKRFTNLRDHHELYCLGHMIEAAIAYYQNTGKSKLLDAAIRYVDVVNALFGPGEHQIHGYPGHEIIELALVKLYRLTNESKYLLLAKYFIDERGQEPLYLKEESIRYNRTFFWNDTYGKYQYYQAGRPVRQQETAEGHAVRAVYLYSGMADIAQETQDEELLEVCTRIWDNITQKQMYITGGIGATHHGEAFTYDYDLPNDTIYAETCASIGLVFYAMRLFEITGDSKYTDVIERALYNGVISGISLDGTRFFYVNPLEVLPEACLKDNMKKHVQPMRQKWFSCACCPPNLSRLITSIGHYIYSVSTDTFWMNLFIGGKAHTDFHGSSVVFHIKTDYPWRETVEIIIETKEPVPFKYAIRIPKWCQRFSVLLNGAESHFEMDKGYAYLDRQWQNGDRIMLCMEMPVQIVCANPKVRENVCKAAITRGPLVYCLEEADNGKELHKVFLNRDTRFKAEYEPDFLNGTVTLSSHVNNVSEKYWGFDELYKPCDTSCAFEDRFVKWIPYYSWANRTAGEMTVWVPLR